MASNRAVTFMGPHRMEVQDKEYPKLEDPQGRKVEHAAILKLVTTNICGSDLHIYNGRFAAPPGMQMGHENTGVVVEVGPHVQYIRNGDICSVPFNVACGTCRNCKEGHTDVCLRSNEELGFCGAYGFNLGGWQGGQAEYMMVPWADFQLLKFPDNDQALEKIRDLTLLSDILPTGYLAASRRESVPALPSISRAPDRWDAARRPARSFSAHPASSSPTATKPGSIW
jgi:glutathione-independent formaldehyde dehydrogenase